LHHIVWLSAAPNQPSFIKAMTIFCQNNDLLLITFACPVLHTGIAVIVLGDETSKAKV